MKNLFAIVIISGILFSCNSTPKKDYNFSINGTIDGDYAGHAYLHKREAGEWILLDSSLVQDNTFRFEGTIDYPEVYYMSIKNEKSYATVFTEQADITVKVNLEDFANPEISGSKSQAEYEDYLAKNDVYEEKLSDVWTQIKAARDEGNVEQEALLEEEFDKTDEEKEHLFFNMQKIITLQLLQHMPFCVMPIITTKQTWSL